LLYFPRFGVIVVVMSMRNITAGEEFFADYGYGFEQGPAWYKSLFLKHMDEHPEDDIVIRRLSRQRTRAELEKSYKEYLSGL